MGLDVQTGSRQLQRVIASTSRNIESNVGRVVAEVCPSGCLNVSCKFIDLFFSQSSKLLESAELYQGATSERISAVRKATETLMEQGAREDSPTGRTPKKRITEYIDRWELTKSREVILKEWRKRRPSTAGFAPLQLPASDGLRSPRIEEPKDPAHETPTAIFVPELSEPAEQDLGTRFVEDLGSESDFTASPPAFIPSLASSVSSIAPVAVSFDAPPPLKSKLPTKGTLTERSTNLIPTRGSRRPR